MHKSQHIRKRCHWYFTFTKQTLYKLHSATLSSKPWPPILLFGALLKFGTNVLGDGCTCTWNMLMTVLLCAPCVCVCREQSFRSFSTPSFLTWISYWKAHFCSWLSSRGNLKICQFVTTTGVAWTNFGILLLWVWGSELGSSCPHVCRTSLPTMEPFPQSCLVDFHTGTFATTFILTCFSSLFSVMLGLCFR